MKSENIEIKMHNKSKKRKQNKTNKNHKNMKSNKKLKNPIMNNQPISYADLFRLANVKDITNPTKKEEAGLKEIVNAINRERARKNEYIEFIQIDHEVNDGSYSYCKYPWDITLKVSLVGDKEKRESLAKLLEGMYDYGRSEKEALEAITNMGFFRIDRFREYTSGMITQLNEYLDDISSGRVAEPKEINILQMDSKDAGYQEGSYNPYGLHMEIFSTPNEKERIEGILNKDFEEGKPFKEALNKIQRLNKYIIMIIK